MKSVKLDFSVELFQNALRVTPVLNGISLSDEISAFERERNFDPAGGYGGLVPSEFNYGPLDRYFLSLFDRESYFAKLGRIYLLGCECGEVGCWPLEARVAFTAEAIVWDSFHQPHRPERDYSGFGPFSFGKDQYEQAAIVLCDSYREASSSLKNSTPGAALH